MKRKKQVLYIVSDIDKSLAFEWIVLHIDRSHYDLRFIILSKSKTRLGVFLTQQGIPHQHFFYRRKSAFPGLCFALVRSFLRARPDIIHCHLLKAGILGLTAGWIVGVRTRIYTRHHSDFHHRYFPSGIKWDRLCNFLATRIVAPSLVVQHVLCNWEGVSPEKVCLLPHGFDLDYFTHVPVDRIELLRNKIGISYSDTPVVGVISRCEVLKGLPYVLQAFKRLLVNYPKAVLVLFGAVGSWYPNLLNELASIDPARYRVVPFEEDLAAIYKVIDLLLQVSVDTTVEAFGQTYVEALAAGVPSVFTLSGIAAEFIQDEHNALVVPFEDAGAIHEQSVRILTNPLLASKLKAQGLEDVRKLFALPKMINALESLYDA